MYQGGAAYKVALMLQLGGRRACLLLLNLGCQAHKPLRATKARRPKNTLFSIAVKSVRQCCVRRTRFDIYGGRERIQKLARQTGNSHETPTSKTPVL